MGNKNNFYTLEEKLELYIGALDFLRGLDESYVGLCRAMKVAVERFTVKYALIHAMQFYDNHLMIYSPFPELLVFKPVSLVFSNGVPNGPFWFPLDEEGQNKRVEILELIIKNLKNVHH
jgi:hypothetical protein